MIDNAFGTNLEISKLNENDDLKARLHDLEEESKTWNEHECILMSSVSSLQYEFDVMKSKNKELELQFEKFFMSSKSLDVLLASQRHYLDKSGLGYDPMKLYETLNSTQGKVKGPSAMAKDVTFMDYNSFTRVTHSKAKKVKVKKFWVPRDLKYEEKRAYVKATYDVNVYSFVVVLTNLQGSKAWITKTS